MNISEIDKKLNEQAANDVFENLKGGENKQDILEMIMQRFLELKVDQTLSHLSDDDRDLIKFGKTQITDEGMVTSYKGKKTVLKMTPEAMAMAKKLQTEANSGKLV